MINLNNVVLVGRLTKDPDLRKTQNNKSCLSFCLAVDRKFKNENGERSADFINCVAWNQQADYLANYAAKGDIVGVEGSIQTRSYEKDGQNVYVTEIVASNVQLINFKKADQQEPVKQDDTKIVIDQEELPFY